MESAGHFRANGASARALPHEFVAETADPVFNPCFFAGRGAVTPFSPEVRTAHYSGSDIDGRRFHGTEDERHYCATQPPAGLAPGLVRRLPVGAEPQPGAACISGSGRPRCVEVAVEIDGRAPVPLTAEAGGYFSGLVAEARARACAIGSASTRSTRLSPTRLALPARGTARAVGGRRSRQLPLDRRAGAASRARGRSSTRCTSAPSRRRGPGQAAARELPELAELGITCVELMPVADFPGRFGWGYDGVDLFAPTRLYGRPDDFRRFVDRAHALGIAVILDVVYNHFGPDGNYLELLLATTTSPTATRTSGARRSISTARTRGPVREFFSPMPATGSTSSTSTACGSTRRSRSSTHSRRPHPRRDRPRACARRRGDAHDLRRRRERAAGGAPGAPAGARRLRARRAVERRFPPQRDGRADRAARGLLHRLPRHAAGVRRRREIRLPVPGPALRLAEEARAARRRSTCRPSAFVVFLQNHDQIANSAAASACTQLTSPGRWRAHDRAICC